MTKSNTAIANEKREFLKECFIDPVLFLRFFLPDKFSKRIPWVHRGLLSIFTRQTAFLLRYGELDKIERHFTFKDEDGTLSPIFKVTRDDAGTPIEVTLYATENTTTIMPRGFSKTTLIGQGGTLYKILYEETKFFVYGSETGTHAETQLSNIMRELESNGRIIEFFGNLVPARNDRQKWTAGEFETTTGVVGMARGRGAQVRGLNVNGNRPDLLIFDDVEDNESVSTPEQRKKASDWFYNEFLPAINKKAPNPQVFGLGTLLHKEALLMLIMKDPTFQCCKFGALDLDGESIWSDHMSVQAIEKIKRQYTSVGKLSSFFLEYMSEFRDDDSAKFKEKNMVVVAQKREDLIAVALVIDPAISTKLDADYCAFGVVGVKTGGRYAVLEAMGRRGIPASEQVKIYFELSKKFGVTIHGIEAQAYQAALAGLLKEEMHRNGQYFEIHEIRHRTKKDERVEGILQPRYNAGYMEHDRHFPLYVEQLLDWPRGKKDIPDAVAMAIALLDPYAALAVGEGVDLEADVYEPLDEWRSH